MLGYRRDMWRYQYLADSMAFPWQLGLIIVEINVGNVYSSFADRWHDREGVNLH